ncbi:MAG: hypothetical protein FWE32_08205 [Oscillospiraceae bacterium]|nr:hypothetical protein [Oscillospiraceae bacterium]
MKKKIMIALCLTALLSLAACGSEQTPVAPIAPVTPAAEENDTEYGYGQESENPPAVAEQAGPVRTPEDYIAVNHPADIIIGEEGAFYAQASHVSWIEERLDLADAGPFGAVKRSGVTEDFQSWDATALPEGTQLLRHNQEPDLLIAEMDGQKIPYLRFNTGS